MPARFYRPRTFQGLFGGTHNTNGPFPPAQGGDGHGGFPVNPTIGNDDTFNCSDNRRLFGFALCLQGFFFDSARFDFGNVGDLRFVDVGDGTWEDWVDANAALLERQLPPGVTASGPTLRDISPAPDFALILAASFRTVWYGFHTGCCPASKGCGPYKFEHPTARLDAFGEPRTDGRGVFYPDLISGPTVFDATGTDAGEDPDPTVAGTLAVSGADSLIELPCPLSGTYQFTGHLPAFGGGILRPPTPSYLPNPNSANEAEAFDARNTAAKELWAWDDVVNLGAKFVYGLPAQRWSRVAWGDSTGELGGATFGATPFWIIAPEPEEPEPGRIDVGEMTNHVRRIRGGRTGHDAQAP